MNEPLNSTTTLKRLIRALNLLMLLMKKDKFWETLDLIIQLPYDTVKVRKRQLEATGES